MARKPDRKPPELGAWRQSLGDAGPYLGLGMQLALTVVLFTGLGYLVEEGYVSRTNTDYCVYTECFDASRVCLGHRGGWWAEIEVFGEIAHGSMPFLGDCAVRHMGAVLAEFEAELFPALAARRTEMPVVPEGARQSTMNINSIHGGQAERDDPTALPSHCVPDSCRIVIDRRFLIEEPLEAVRGEVRGALDRVAARRETFRYDLRELNHVLPSMTDREAPVVRAVSRAVERDESVHLTREPHALDRLGIDLRRLSGLIVVGVRPNRDPEVAHLSLLLEASESLPESVVVKDVVAA